MNCRDATNSRYREVLSVGVGCFSFSFFIWFSGHKFPHVMSLFLQANFSLVFKIDGDLQKVVMESRYCVIVNMLFFSAKVAWDIT